MDRRSLTKYVRGRTRKLYQSDLDKIRYEINLQGVRWSNPDLDVILASPLINREWVGSKFFQDIPSSPHKNGEVSVDIFSLKSPMLYSQIVDVFEISVGSVFRFAPLSIAMFLSRFILGKTNEHNTPTSLILSVFGTDIETSEWDFVKVPTFVRHYRKSPEDDTSMRKIEVIFGLNPRDVVWPIGTTFILVNNTEFPKVVPKDP